MKRIAIYGAIISIIIFIFILIIGETFEFDFLTSALMIGIGVCFFFLFLTLMCVFWGMSVNNRTGKILLILLVCIFLIGVLITFNDTLHIYKDKGSYEKEEFVIVEGKPDEISFNRDNYLNKLIVDGVELNVTMLDMTKVDFDQKFHDKEIIVKYLPKSKLVVKIDNIEQ